MPGSRRISSHVFHLFLFYPKILDKYQFLFKITQSNGICWDLNTHFLKTVKVGKNQLSFDTNDDDDKLSRHLGKLFWSVWYTYIHSSLKPIEIKYWKPGGPQDFLFIYIKWENFTLYCFTSFQKKTSFKRGQIFSEGPFLSYIQGV